MTERRGFRGYIASRPVGGNRIPQHVQNLVVREYARRRDLEFLLSATELSVPNSYVVLNDVLASLEGLEGIIVYSLFMLPSDPQKRSEIVEKVVASGGQFHAAVEEFVAETEDDLARLDEIWRVNEVLPHCLGVDELRATLGSDRPLYE